MYAAGLIPSANERRTRCSSSPNPAVGRNRMLHWTQRRIISSSIATAQKKAGNDAARVLADHASALSTRLPDHPYAIPAGTPIAMAPAIEVSIRIALLPTAAAKGLDSLRNSCLVFMRREF